MTETQAKIFYYLVIIFILLCLYVGLGLAIQEVKKTQDEKFCSTICIQKEAEYYFKEKENDVSCFCVKDGVIEKIINFE